MHCEASQLLSLFDTGRLAWQDKMTKEQELIFRTAFEMFDKDGRLDDPNAQQPEQPDPENCQRN